MTRDQRLAISLAPEIKLIYQETAGLMGIPASTFIARVLAESAPSIKAMQEPLKAALTSKKQALKGMNVLIDGLKVKADEKQLDILEEMKKGSSKKSK
jgi:hypothetical protein